MKWVNAHLPIVSSRKLEDNMCATHKITLYKLIPGSPHTPFDRKSLTTTLDDKVLKMNSVSIFIKNDKIVLSWIVCDRFLLYFCVPFNLKLLIKPKTERTAVSEERKFRIENKSLDYTWTFNWSASADASDWSFAFKIHLMHANGIPFSGKYMLDVTYTYMWFEMDLRKLNFRYFVMIKLIECVIIAALIVNNHRLRTDTPMLHHLLINHRWRCVVFTLEWSNTIKAAESGLSSATKFSSSNTKKKIGEGIALWQCLVNTLFRYMQRSSSSGKFII